MATEAEFLAKMRADPGDDTPRLVFADWLADRGEHARAEFVRVQVELAGTACSPLCNLPTTDGRDSGCVCERRALTLRDAELFEATGMWYGLPEPVRDIVPKGGIFANYLTIRRGFVAAVRCEWADWCRHADALLACVPGLDKVTLTSWPGLDADSLRWPDVRGWELPEPDPDPDRPVPWWYNDPTPDMLAAARRAG